MDELPKARTSFNLGHNLHHFNISIQLTTVLSVPLNHKPLFQLPSLLLGGHHHGSWQTSTLCLVSACLLEDANTTDCSTFPQHLSNHANKWYLIHVLCTTVCMSVCMWLSQWTSLTITTSKQQATDHNTCCWHTELGECCDGVVLGSRYAQTALHK